MKNSAIYMKYCGYEVKNASSLSSRDCVPVCS